MDNFDFELKNNEELLDSIWINYFGNRNYREEMATIDKLTGLYNQMQVFNAIKHLIGTIGK